MNIAYYIDFIESSGLKMSGFWTIFDKTNKMLSEQMSQLLALWKEFLMTPTIVVMQTSDAGRIICREVLGTILRLQEGRDFVVLSRPPSQELFVPGMRQLFITGSFAGMDDGLVAELIQRIRGYNPQVVVASYAIWELSGDFDLRIKKIDFDPIDNIKTAIEGFLTGTVNRVQ